MITLTGMSGVGKTSTGRELAHMLDYKFLDTDTVLEERCKGEKLPNILKRLGELAFLQFESQVVCNLQPGKETVLATGGSVAYSEVAMQHLHDMSFVVHLDASVEILAERGNLRLNNHQAYARRSIVRCGTRTLEQLYRQRHTFYRRWANLTIDTSALTPQQVAFKIRDVLK